LHPHSDIVAMSTVPIGKRALVVDDDASVLRLMTHWLTRAGYAVVPCDTFEQGKQQLTASPPDVLLTDLRLGAFNGLQLVILARAQSPDTIVVVMSAFDDMTLRDEAARCGAHYLMKPFSLTQLLEVTNGESGSGQPRDPVA
jgi:DNA-binding response OmpR family regulator